MTYQNTLNWLFSQLPMYQRQGRSAYKTDLNNTVLLIEHLKQPQEHFKSVHVAGTNGKGSTSHMLASVLQEAGYKVGLYTSPHLKDFRERIKVNGEEVSKQFVIGFVKRNQAFFETHALSFFEMTVGMAFEYFKRQKVDVAIVEVGLGGRLDSTNIITPEVSVITNIGMDHTQFLGDTLEAIAYEKAGIIKPNIPVVIGETQAETAPVFKAVAAENHTEIVFADKTVKTSYKTDLLGAYQAKNAITAIQTFKALQERGFKITSEHIKNGLMNVIKNTKLLGRWQVLNDEPKVVCDTGHNREGLSYVMDQLSNEAFDVLHIVFGVVSDKDLSTITDLLPKKATYYFCKPDIARGLEADTLKSKLGAYDLKGEAYNSVKEAYNMALKNSTKQDLIFIGGSTFVVAEII